MPKPFRWTIAKREQLGSIGLVFPTSRLLSAKVRAFIDLAEKTRRWSFT